MLMMGAEGEFFQLRVAEGGIEMFYGACRIGWIGIWWMELARKSCQLVVNVFNYRDDRLMSWLLKWQADPVL